MEALMETEVNEVIKQAESIVEQRRREAAEQAGLDIERIEARRLELSMLREAGLLIDLDVHGTSMFQTRTTYAELGISANDVRAERLRRGRKDLFPVHAKKLRSLEARARMNLYAHSFRLAVFGSWSWMPWTAYSEFKAKHDEIVQEVEALKAQMLAEYEDVYQRNRAYFERVARRAWKDMLADYDAGQRVMIQTTEGIAFDSQAGYERFVDYVVSKALVEMPLPEEIEHGVRIDYRTSILYGEHEMAQDDAALAQARARQAQARAAEAQARLQKAETELSILTAKSRAQAEIEAFKQAEIEHARQQLMEMGSPIQNALNELRANLYDAVQTLLSGIKANGGFRGKATNKAAELYAYWQQLNGNLLQDDELEAMLQRLDGLMDSYRASKKGREAKMGDIESALHRIAALTNEEARKLRKHQASRASALEL